MNYVHLDVDKVFISQGKFKVSNVSFRLKSRNILGLVGRSGSGKSTIIKTLVGLKKQDKGYISAYINDKKIPLSEVVGYSPQNNSLYPFLTLEENLITFGNLHKIKRYEIDKRIEFLLKRLDLTKSRKKKIIQLSGGMQKRADLAVTLIHSPKIIILDEPFTGLDVSLQRFIWGLLRDLSNEDRIIIISSHMLNDIQKFCNQFGLVDNGIFYSTGQLMDALKKSREKNLEAFLEKLFTRDLMSDD